MTEILCHRVNKQYRNRDTAAVADVSFDISAGELVAIAGANGAGKSTVIKLLVGVSLPTSGTVLLRGLNPAHDRRAVAQQVGVVLGQRNPLWEEFSLRQALILLGRLNGVRESTIRKRSAQLAQSFSIEHLLDIKLSKMSSGQRMRCTLACALIHAPPIIFLDEPTIGLDSEGKKGLRRLMRELNEQQGTTAIITSHDADDLKFICDRLLLLQQGRLVYDGPIKQLAAWARTSRYLEVTYDRPVNRGQLHASGFEPIYRSETSFGVRLRNTVSIVDMLTALEKYGHIVDVSVSGGDLEDILSELYTTSGSNGIATSDEANHGE